MTTLTKEERVELLRRFDAKETLTTEEQAVAEKMIWDAFKTLRWRMWSDMMEIELAIDLKLDEECRALENMLVYGVSHPTVEEECKLTITVDRVLDGEPSPKVFERWVKTRGTIMPRTVVTKGMRVELSVPGATLYGRVLTIPVTLPQVMAMVKVGGG
jgi:hypothetical protein